MEHFPRLFAASFCKIEVVKVFKVLKVFKGVKGFNVALRAGFRLPTRPR